MTKLTGRYVQDYYLSNVINANNDIQSYVSSGKSLQTGEFLHLLSNLDWAVEALKDAMRGECE